MQDREPLYVISVAARLLGMHAQTLRKYERERFVAPSRTKGRLRLYSAEDIERLRQVKYLVEERGLNLAGVELVLTLSTRLRQLHDAVWCAETLDEARECFAREADELFGLLGMAESWHAARDDQAKQEPQLSPRVARYDRVRR